MARKCFYVCAGMLMLALSYHFGARNATAQVPGNPVVGMALYGTFLWVVTANGDLYGSVDPAAGYPWVPFPNVFSGGPTPAQRESFGSLKSRYRGERGAAQPAPQDR